MEISRIRYLQQFEIRGMKAWVQDAIPFAILDVDDRQRRCRVVRLSAPTIDENGSRVPVRLAVVSMCNDVGELALTQVE